MNATRSGIRKAAAVVVVLLIPLFIGLEVVDAAGDKIAKWILVVFTIGIIVLLFVLADTFDRLPPDDDEDG